MKTQNSSLELSHFPVMLSEVVKISSPNSGGLFVDCTFGGGGYSKAILQFPDTKVIALDRDKSVISIANKLEKKFKDRFKFYQIKKKWSCFNFYRKLRINKGWNHKYNARKII